MAFNICIWHTAYGLLRCKIFGISKIFKKFFIELFAIFSLFFQSYHSRRGTHTHTHTKLKTDQMPGLKDGQNTSEMYRNEKYFHNNFHDETFSRTKKTHKNVQEGARARDWILIFCIEQMMMLWIQQKYQRNTSQQWKSDANIKLWTTTSFHNKNSDQITQKPVFRAKVLRILFFVCENTKFDITFLFIGWKWAE